MAIWRERLLMARDKVLANKDFQSRAASLPITRHIARRRAAGLFDICAGFVYSQILYACVELRVFDKLLNGPQDASTLAQKLGLKPEACERLLTAAAALDLVERRGSGRYGLGPFGAALAGDASLNAMIEHHRHLYADLKDPVALLRGEQGGTELSHYWPYADASNPKQLTDQQVGEYSQLMSASQPLVAEEVLDAYDFSRHTRLMDVGGGEGAFLIMAARQSPTLKLTLVDLPAVTGRAERALDANGLAERSTIASLDIFTEPLPHGADVISLVRVALDHDDSKVSTLYSAAYRALPPGGVMVVAEPMIEGGRNDAMAAAYFGMYLLAMGRGAPRTPEQHKKLALAAGFSDVEFRKGQRVLGTNVMIARRK